MARGPSPLRPVRLAAGLAAIAGWSLAIAWLGCDLPAPVAALAGVAFALPLMSLGEWLVHGVLYHRALPGLAVIRRIHHHGHHVVLFPPRRYRKSAGHEFMRVRAPVEPFRMSDNRWDNALTKWSQIALHFAVGVPLVLWPAWKLGGRTAFATGALVALGVTSFLLAHVHGAIHTPRGRWIERQAWFKWLDCHHYIHHLDVRANINFLLPLCDLLLGTHRREVIDSASGRVRPDQRA
jgi:hypothetical protein